MLSSVDRSITLLNVDVVACLLSTSRDVVYNPSWRRRVGLRAVRVGRALRFRVSDVEAVITRGLERDPEAE
jgi:Helix-turn-helix domain